jgi:hypothetical protein
MILHLDDDTTPNDLLARIAAAPETTIERFELAVPSLNDIFIQVAGEGILNEDQVNRANRIPTASDARKDKEVMS